MIVIDASVVVDVLIADARASPTRDLLAREEFTAPDLVDTEVASALRGLWLSHALDAPRLERAVHDLGLLPCERQPSMLLTPRAMQLRANLTPYDAVYVALAETLGCALLTKDRRLASAPGLRCEVMIAA
jgi:predicted nucleic acid-binding protein